MSLFLFPLFFFFSFLSLSPLFFFFGRGGGGPGPAGPPPPGSAPEWAIFSPVLGTRLPWLNISSQISEVQFIPLSLPLNKWTFCGSHSLVDCNVHFPFKNKQTNKNKKNLLGFMSLMFSILCHEIQCFLNYTSRFLLTSYVGLIWYDAV